MRVGTWVTPNPDCLSELGPRLLVALARGAEPPVELARLVGREDRLEMPQFFGVALLPGSGA
eukprot:5298980-Pyramimonas_sp.AAC.1